MQSWSRISYTTCSSFLFSFASFLFSLIRFQVPYDPILPIREIAVVKTPLRSSQEEAARRIPKKPSVRA
jgi:hypothetical protein